MFIKEKMEKKRSKISNLQNKMKLQLVGYQKEIDDLEYEKRAVVSKQWNAEMGLEGIRLQIQEILDEPWKL